MLFNTQEWFERLQADFDDPAVEVRLSFEGEALALPLKKAVLTCAPIKREGAVRRFFAGETESGERWVDMTPGELRFDVYSKGAHHRGVAESAFRQILKQMEQDSAFFVEEWAFGEPDFVQALLTYHSRLILKGYWLSAQEEVDA